MNALLIPIGSHGDVHPFVGLGLALKRRGHDVTLLTNGYFEPLPRRAGLEFVELSTANEYRWALEQTELWHPVKSFKIIVEWSILRTMRRLYDLIRDRYVPGDTVVVAPAMALGARLAQEKLGVPLATVILQPSMLRSEYEPPIVAHFGWIERKPRLVSRLAFRFWDVWIDRLLAPGLDAFRTELHLPRVRRFFHGWWLSPQLVLGLFPDWYASPQPDWPIQLRLTGFPLYDERGLDPLDPEVNAFLAAGPPPIVFTPGTAMTHGETFFAAAAEACRMLARRGILLTRFPDQVPRSLPQDVRHFNYIPFSQVLPRAAALVHHGGIGTTAQGLAAGIPQLVMPLAHDQFDNAVRLKRLGVGATLARSAFRAPALAQALAGLLDSADVARECRAHDRRFTATDTFGDACRRIEELCSRRPLPAA